MCRQAHWPFPELALVGNPSILVPSKRCRRPPDTQCHVIGKHGAALMVKDVEARDQLMPQLAALIRDEENKTLTNHLKALGKADAADVIAREIINIANQYKVNKAWIRQHWHRSISLASVVLAWAPSPGTSVPVALPWLDTTNGNQPYPTVAGRRHWCQLYRRPRCVAAKDRPCCVHACWPGS